MFRFINDDDFDDEFVIFFKNLDEDTQKELLKFYNIDEPKDLNLDVVPLFSLNKPK